MIKNKTQGTVVAREHKVCRSIWSKARGLMFTGSKSVVRESLVFEFDGLQKTGLHMFFVFYPIDILFLDEKQRVVEMKEGFRPFTFYNPKELSKYVIELPAGKIAESNTSVGDEINW